MHYSTPCYIRHLRICGFGIHRDQGVGLVSSLNPLCCSGVTCTFTRGPLQAFKAYLHLILYSCNMLEYLLSFSAKPSLLLTFLMINYGKYIEDKIYHLNHF